MKNTHCRTWIMARKLKNVENETETLYGLENFREIQKTWGKKNAHSRTWSIARKQKIIENEKHTLQDVKYGEKH